MPVSFTVIRRLKEGDVCMKVDSFIRIGVRTLIWYSSDFFGSNPVPALN